MKILVMSDTHGRANICLDIVEKNMGDIDLFVHLGDGRKEFTEIMDMYGLKYVSVMGNCDYGSGSMEEKFSAENFTITACHGHYYGVSLTKETYLKHLQGNSDIGLFGHSHIAHFEKIGNTYLINPGSAAKSRYGENSYCILTLNGSSLKVNFYSSNTFLPINIENI